ncbi:MAG TPA: flagellar protein FlbB [Pseudolabrys sp.]|nr:flagellar protein FlbB [Pseudolabrys sp.]
MMRFARDFRLLPIVLLATVSLFALKVSGLVFDGGYTLAQRLDNRNKPGLTIAAPESVPDYPKIVFADGRDGAAPAGKRPWAQQMFNFNGPGRDDVTGSVGEQDKNAGPPLKTSDKPPDGTKVEVAGLSGKIEPGHINSSGERAILESLQGRREELEARNRELDMRENLLKAAEKRVEAKVAELKDVEARVKTEMGSRDEAEQKRFKTIVAMYENMKPKEAARIFDRLDLKILVQVATHMNPRTMSEILANMSPEAAEKLTVELANRGQSGSQPTDKLPKIEGKPAS